MRVANVLSPIVPARPRVLGFPLRSKARGLRFPINARRNRLVLSLHKPLVAGGAAEEYEQHVQTLFRDGFQHLVTDLRDVAHLDSAGVRALVRGYTTARRIGGTFRLVAPSFGVAQILRMARLDNVLDIYDSVEAASARQWPWYTIRLLLAGTTLCGGLTWIGLTWPMELVDASQTGFLPWSGGTSTPFAAGRLQPFVDVFKLVAAALIGMLVTAVQQHYLQDKPLNRSLVHAQVLLAAAGALMMLIIGNSLARAFGIAGAASIVRFRTPVDDPRDITILFLLMALGMACGLGALAVAGLGTMFLCSFLVMLEHWGSRKPRTIILELVAEGREFPTAHVENVFAQNQIVFESREVSQGKEATVKYRATLNPSTSLEDLSAQLMTGASGLKSLTWSSKKG